MSDWITHVKKVAKQKKITYKEALKVAGASYKKKASSDKKPEKKDNKKKMKKGKDKKMEGEGKYSK